MEARSRAATGRQELPRGGIKAFATAAETASALQAAHTRNTSVNPAEEVAGQKAPKPKSGKISRAVLKIDSTIAMKDDDKSSSAQSGNHRYLPRLDYKVRGNGRKAAEYNITNSSATGATPSRWN